MLIDWFTVCAQIVNFLILMALLKYFLYDRITGAMDAREEKINSRLQDADRKEKEAQEKAEALDHEKRELDQKRDRLLADAKEKAESKRRQWEQDARSELEEQRAQWQKALADQKDSFARSLQQSVVDQVYAICRRALRNLANESLEEQIIEAFIDRVKKMDSSQKRQLNQSVKSADQQAVIQSAFETATEMRQKITRALRAEISDQLNIDYQTDGDLLAGIELKINGKKIAWSLQDYLEVLEEKVADTLKEQAHQDTRRQKTQAAKEENKER